MTVPLCVYLDSSDFSTLSSPGISSEDESIRSRLSEWAISGQVQFVFSGAHLMEMAPLSATYTPSAAARADLLVTLCRRNAVISFDKLISWELRCLSELAGPVASVVSATAEWYPEWGNLVSPVQWVDAINEVDVTGKEHGLNREQRRQLKKALFKGGRPTKLTRQFMAVNELSSDYTELLKRYPMREEDARILGLYVMGKATAAQANEAFLESLRNPGWIMRWFSNHEARLTPFFQWLREPGEKLLASARELAAAARRIHELRNILGPSYQAESLTANGWARLQDETLCNVAKRAVERLNPGVSNLFSSSDVDRCCPGLSVFVRSVHSALRDSTSETPRQSKASDFADGVHAMYSPYVDIFRADSYMANHVRRHVERYETVVVPKLRQLVPAISDRLAQ